MSNSSKPHNHSTAEEKKINMKKLSIYMETKYAMKTNHNYPDNELTPFDCNQVVRKCNHLFKK